MQYCCVLTLTIENHTDHISDVGEPFPDVMVTHGMLAQVSIERAYYHRDLSVVSVAYDAGKSFAKPLR